MSTKILSKMLDGFIERKNYKGISMPIMKNKDFKNRCRSFNRFGNNVVITPNTVQSVQ